MAGTNDHHRVATALGILAEAVSALRGVEELCASRTFGPTHILPALEGFLDSSLGLGGQLRLLFMLLSREAAGTPLAVAVAALEASPPPPLHTLTDVFERSCASKLGARERLELERVVAESADALEALRALADLVHAALHPRLVELSLHELLVSRGSAAPAGRLRPGAPSAVDVELLLEQDVPVDTDPFVAWRLLEGLVRFASQGGSPVSVTVRAAGGGVAISVAPGSVGARGARRLRLPTGPGCEAAATVLFAVAQHTHMGLTRQDASYHLVVSSQPTGEYAIVRSSGTYPTVGQEPGALRSAKVPRDG